MYKYKLAFFSTIILNSCSYISSDILNLEKPKEDISINSKKSELDLTKKVEIKILNPENKSSVEWYKKDEKTLVMKVASQANLVGIVTLKDETKSSNIDWSSSDRTIAVVNNGKVNANKVGVTTILATSNLDSNYKGLLNIEVVDDANFAETDSKSINNVKEIMAYTEINNKKINSLKISLNKKTINVSSSITLSDYSKNSNVIWESSDDSIATVDQNGKVLFKKDGSVSIISKYKLNPDSKALINLEISKNNDIIENTLFINELTNINIGKKEIDSSKPKEETKEDKNKIDQRNNSVISINPIKKEDS
ncbi:MAG: Ig-like domain-containing protein [Cyanobacteriota bacterium]